MLGPVDDPQCVDDHQAELVPGRLVDQVFDLDRERRDAVGLHQRLQLVRRVEVLDRLRALRHARVADEVDAPVAGGRERA
jgi:hypothetical protein